LRWRNNRHRRTAWTRRADRGSAATTPRPRSPAAIGYNGNRDRATRAINQDDLVVDEHYGDQLPGSVDPQAQKDGFAADPRIDPPKVIPFAASPQRGQWSGGEHSWVARAAVSSSRLGVDSIAVPQESDFAGTAVPRLSRSQQISLTGSVGAGVGSLGGSIATGDSTSQVDFLDMNGDLFPDVVGADGIQYSDPNGALGGTHGPIPDGAVRRSTNQAGNAGAFPTNGAIPTLDALTEHGPLSEIDIEQKRSRWHGGHPRDELRSTSSVRWWWWSIRPASRGVVVGRRWA
jgi:hypothetical protein